MSTRADHVSVQRLVRVKRIDEERRLVFGEVYAPNQLDTYGEFMLAEDIVTMAHRFMRLDMGKVIDTQHDNVPNGSWPVECFVARDGDPDYTPGAWVLGVFVEKEDVWARVKSGEINGFSFEAFVSPVECEVEFFVTRDHVGATEAADDHDHAYFVQIGDDGNVIGGWTSPAADGHTHQIRRASVTEAGSDGSIPHRFHL